MSTPLTNQVPANPLARLAKATYTDLFTGYSPFEKVFFPALILLQVVVSSVAFEGWLSFITAFAGMVCVILVGKGRLSNYFFGIVQNVPYLVLAYQAYFIGEITIAAFYVLTQFWGLYMWRKNMRAAKTRPELGGASFDGAGQLAGSRAVSTGADAGGQGAASALASAAQGTALDVQTRRLTLPAIAGVLALLAAASWGYGVLLNGWGSNQPYVDAFTTVIALISQVLMVYRFREQWVGWLVLNAVQIYLWSTVEGGGNMAIMAMYLGFIANSAYGWYNWTKLSRKVQD
ncbi:nicotinamide riboside transporter PnuC [Rothia nasimurium]|uniref:nicotinamide riboside transporter PnuC n=1 Tax=Rothia nasimurium TaxID=85336 RepID=UPI003BA0FC8E